MSENFTTFDGINSGGQPWYYSDIVKEHFFNPHNFMRSDEEDRFAADGIGRVGSPACGDEMVLWIKVDAQHDKISDCRWRTFGCGSAIASTSILSVMITENGGMSLSEALKLRSQDIMKRLGGLPDRKVHCSVLGDKALRAAINDYFHKSDQHDRVVVEGGRIVDAVLKITDQDIEQAILDGAQTFEDVQKKLKVGAGNPEAKPEIEQLIRFYREKYYGV